jgi:very-short-patch-repair endonuclease
VEFSDARSESAFESISRVVFREQRLPPPELQIWVGGDGLVIGRVDFLWRRYRTIAEADGAAKYQNPDRARRQLRRDAELRAAGFEIVHFTWGELHMAPAQVAQSIRMAFRRGVASSARDREATPRRAAS